MGQMGRRTAHCTPAMEAAEKLGICKGKLNLMQAKPIGDAFPQIRCRIEQMDTVLWYSQAAKQPSSQASQIATCAGDAHKTLLYHRATERGLLWYRI